MSSRFYKAIVSKGRQELKSKGQLEVDLFSKLMWLEAKLQASKKRWHRMSDWWKDTLKGFLRSKKRRLVLRVGRRGGKSSTLCRLVVVLILFGSYDIPAGDIGEFIFMSVSKREAQKRLNTIRQIFDELGVPYKATAERIKLTGTNLHLCVYPASAKFTVGMTCVGLLGDEVARWENDDNSANPAEDIYSSVRPAMLTQPFARELMSSSPWSELDYHYDTVELGDTDDQMVAIAPTWKAHPALTQDRCRRLEPDDESFWREYGAVPMRSGARTFYDPKAIDQAMWEPITIPRQLEIGVEVVAGADFAFTSDWSACQIFHKRGKIYYQADTMVLRPEKDKPLKVSETCRKFALLCKKHRANGVMADQYSREAIVEYLAEEGLGFLDAPTDPYKGHVRARVLLNQNLVRLAPDKEFAKLLKQVEGQPTRNSRISIRMPRRKGSGHSDDISAMVLALYQKSGALYDPGAEIDRSFHGPNWEAQHIADLLKKKKQDETEGIFDEDMEFIDYDY